MDQAIYRLPPGFVWPSLGHPGLVPIDSLMGDPIQPRKYFDEDELDALAETMKESNAGLQREIITVRLATNEEMKQNPGVRYVIKSGERRWRAAKRAGLTMVEIRVREYASRAEEKLDMYMLNEGRVGLSDIENARYLGELMVDLGCETQEELAQRIGKVQVYVSSYLSILKLVPEGQALMDPSIDERSRLRMGTAVTLSRLSEEVQRDLVERMPKGEGVSIRRQVDWIKAEIARQDLGLEKRRMQPATMRRVILNFFERLESRTRELNGLEEFGRLLDNTKEEQRNDFLGRIKDAQAELSELVEKIENCHRAHGDGVVEVDAPQQPSVVQPAQVVSALSRPVISDTKGSAEAFLARRAELAAKNAPKPSPTLVAKPSVRVSSNPVAQESPASRRSTTYAESGKARPWVDPPTPPPARKGGAERAFTYFDDNLGRMVTDKVNRSKYVQLWDKGLLRFQKEGQQKPDWMPERDEQW